MRKIEYLLIKFKNSNIPIAVCEALFYCNEYHIYEETLKFFQSWMEDLKYFRDLYSLGYKRNNVKSVCICSKHSLIYDKLKNMNYDFDIISAFKISYRDYSGIMRVMNIVDADEYNLLRQLNIDIYDSKLVEWMQSNIINKLIFIRALKYKIAQLEKSNKELESIIAEKNAELRCLRSNKI